VSEPASEWIVRGERRLALLVFLVVFMLYARGAAPGVVIEGDGAEYTAAACVGGVPHQPGYSTYMTLAWGLAKVVGDESSARALALMSAVFGALTAGLAALLLLRLQRRAFPGAPASLAFLASGAGSVLLACGFELWNQSLSAEVYSLSTALLLGVLVLVLASSDPRRLERAALLSGLSFGVHYDVGGPTLLLVLAATLAARRALGPLGLARVALGLALGLATFLYLPLRSLADPAIDYGDPETPGRFWRALVLADMPTGKDIARPLELLLGQLGAVLGLATRQWPALVFVAGAAGGVLCALRRELRPVLAAGALVVGVNYAGILANANFALEPGPISELRFLFLPAYVVLALLAALALGAGLAFLARGSRALALGVGLGLLGALLALVAARIEELDKSENRLFPDYGHALLAVPEGPALLFTFGDNAALIGVYLQVVERERPDVVLVAAGLLQQPWYRAQLAVRHPELVLPAEAAGVAAVARANVARFALYHAQPEPLRLPGFLDVPTGVLMRLAPEGGALTPVVPPTPHFTPAFAPHDLRERSVRADVPMGYARTAAFWRERGEIGTALAACEAGLAVSVPEPRLEEFHTARAVLLLERGEVELSRGRRNEARAAWQAAGAESNDPQVAAWVERRLGASGR